MRKRVQIALALLLVGLAGVIAWQALREREPVYQGKPLSVWLQRYTTHGSIIEVVPEPEADEAVRQINTNAIPSLMLMLRAHDSKLKLGLIGLSGEYRFIGIPVLPACVLIGQAATAFRALGAEASNAVPILIQTYREEVSPDSQCGCAEALGWIGTAAKGAIPHLLGATTSSNSTLRWIAFEALGHIHAEAGLVVPVMTKHLLDSNYLVRLRAVNSLAEFGSEAKPAIPALVQLLEDPNPIMSLDISNALKRIDPEAAARAGVK